MNFTRLELEDDGLYSVYFSDDFYKYFSPYHKNTNTSFFNIYYRLFGLLPQDFYHMVGAVYNASFKPSPIIKRLIYMRFKKEDALKFCKEINRRIQYCINRGDFT